MEFYQGEDDFGGTITYPDEKRKGLVHRKINGFDGGRRL